MAAAASVTVEDLPNEHPFPHEKRVSKVHLPSAPRFSIWSCEYGNYFGTRRQMRGLGIIVAHEVFALMLIPTIDMYLVHSLL